MVARLEKVVASGDVRECGAQLIRVGLLSSTDAVRDWFAARNWSYDVTLGNHNLLPSHRRCFVRRRANLHNLLQVGGKFHDWTIYFRRIRVDLEVSGVSSSSILTCRLSILTC